MSALFRKELRQILPAQIFLAGLLALAGWIILDPHEVLAPFDENQGWLHAAVAAICYAQGLVLGYGQFASERWQGTEAYLVHRATGRSGAFHAKALAGLLSLAVLIVLPAAAFGAVHLGQHPYAGSASVVRLLLVALASCAGFVGYGVGTLAFNVGRSLVARVGLALATSATVFLAVAVAVLPMSIGPLSMSGRFAGVVLGLAAVLLWSARHAFAGSEARSPRGSRAAAFAFAAVAAILCLLPLVLAPYVGVAWAISGFEADAPEIVADAQGELYIATPTDRDRRALWDADREIPYYGRVYDIVDLKGHPVPDSQSLHYTGRTGIDRPFYTVFVATYLHSPELGRQDAREHWFGMGLPFGLTDRWLSRNVNGFSWCFDRSKGEQWVRAHESVTRTHGPPGGGDPEPSWRRLDERTPNLQWIPGVSERGGSYGVFLTAADARFRKLVASAALGGAMLVDAPLPDGDRFVELRLLYHVKQARLGLSAVRRSLVIAERDRYVWNGMGWVAWSDVEGLDRMGLATLDEIEGLQRWSLEASPTKGLGYRVALLDADTGARVVELDVAARTFGQRRSELLATLSCLALPPISAVHSWLQPMHGPHGPLRLAIGTAEVDPLRGQRRTWIVATLALLTGWLVRDLGRRLARRSVPAERRVLWCLLTAVVGLPAYFLGRTIERNDRRIARATSSMVRSDQALVIRTA